MVRRIELDREFLQILNHQVDRLRDRPFDLVEIDGTRFQTCRFYKWDSLTIEGRWWVVTHASILYTDHATPKPPGGPERLAPA